VEEYDEAVGLARSLRRFNRFYFARMRILRDALRGPGYRAPELRVFRELGEAQGGTLAVRIAANLGMDPGRLSRVLSFYRALGYLEECRSPHDGRIRILSLSPRGRRHYEALQREVEGTATFMIQLLSPEDRRRLRVAMDTMEAILRRVPI
jgi:DNA-binding MarR family transcriptional regulator